MTSRRNRPAARLAELAAIVLLAVLAGIALGYMIVHGYTPLILRALSHAPR